MIDIATDGPLGGPQFTLGNAFYTYCFSVFDRRFLTHLYWGAPLSAPLDPTTVLRPRQPDYLPAMRPATEVRRVAGAYALDTLPQEYPAWGAGELREGVFAVRLGDGTAATRLEYVEHEVIDGAVQPRGMEILRSGLRSTLRVRLADPRGDYAVDLFYVVDDAAPALLRWARFTNTGGESIEIENPASAAVDVDGAGKDLVTLSGAWARERHVARRAVGAWRAEVASRNGASGHQTSPFLAIAEATATEMTGGVRGIALCYSGNFRGRCDGDQFGGCRLSLG
ncbi:MAG: hypothetical protein PF508_21365, partial [Spirochaeta sp.]|nr:hypothetical protein [Spirochaeta sp.]